jgi:hypothetical protein
VGPALAHPARLDALVDAARLSAVAVLDPDGGPAGPDATTFVFLLTPA